MTRYSSFSRTSVKSDPSRSLTEARNTEWPHFKSSAGISALSQLPRWPSPEGSPSSLKRRRWRTTSESYSRLLLDAPADLLVCPMRFAVAGLQEPDKVRRDEDSSLRGLLV